MPNRSHKLAAPIVVTVLCLTSLAGWLLALCVLPLCGVHLPLWGILLVSAAVLALAGVAVYCLIERIKEIESGEEDDLDNY